MRTLSVLAQNSSDGFFYPGYINTNNPDDASVTVHFYSLKSQEVKQDDVIIVGGASPWPNLTTGDYVLVQVQYNTTWSVLYVPGVIVSPPNERSHYTKNFLVVTYTQILVDRPRRYIVKIGKEKHDAILECIKELHPRKNPMMRSDACFSGSIYKQRRLLKRAAALNASNLKPRKGILQNERPLRNSFARKAKARKLLTASLRGSSSTFKSSESQISLQRRSDSKLKLKDAVDTNKSPYDSSSDRSRKLTILNQVIETNNNYHKDRQTRNKQSVRETAMKNEKKNTKHIAKNKEEHDVGLFDDVEDELKDIKESIDDRTGSPTYSDSFESLTSKDSKRSTGTAPTNNVKNERETTSATNDRKGTSREAWVNRGSEKTSRSSRASSESIDSRSKSTSKASLNSSRRQTPSGNQQKLRRSSAGNDVFSDVTSSSNRTVTNDLIGRGEEVLARWCDDGWYYFGVVVTDVGGDKYVVRDATGYKETIDRNDILTDKDQTSQILQPGDTVIGLHPNYVFSYAPGHIREVFPSQNVTVEFYDKTMAKLPVTEVFKVSPQKYQNDVRFIKGCEQRLCREVMVVARDDKTGLYLQCKAECPTNMNQNVFIRLPDMTFVKQSAIHIFPFKSRDQRQEQVLEYILAPAETGSPVYLPACVIQTRPFCVRYCDGNMSNELHPSQCFYLNQNYYNNAVNYFFNAQANIRHQEVGRITRHDSQILPGSVSNMDMRSDLVLQPHARTDRQSSSSTSSYDRSRVGISIKRSSIERNLMYNPNVLDYYRRPKQRYTSIERIQE